MGWKGTLRAIEASSRRAERESQRRKREFEKRRKQLEKMQELERATFEFQEYENYIDLLLSVHKEASNTWDWKAIYSSDPPIKPTRSSVHEETAQINLERFKPDLFDTLLNRTKTKRNKLLEAIEEAKQADEYAYQEALQAYEQDYTDWEATRVLAGRMLDFNIDAYLEAIKQTNLFSDISELGSSIEFKVESNYLVEATLHVNSEQVIPSKTKSLLKSGKLSIKPMPKGKFYALYQDYICSCALRVARELFALLPIKMVIVNVMNNLLNTQTGYMEEKLILSVAIPRETLERLNMGAIDPSDSMNNFVHHMAFKKTKGFSAVAALTSSDLQV